MKKILTILLFVQAHFGVAQITTTLNVDPNPTPEISEWQNQNSIAMFTVTCTNPSFVGTQYRLKVQMYLDGVEVLATNNTVSIQTLELGVTTFLAQDIVPYSALVFYGSSFSTTLATTGLLPGGIYSFCVKMVDLSGNIIPPTNVICNPMTITTYQQPELINPIQGQVVQSGLLPALTFNWTPVTPTPLASLGVKYLIAITGVQSGQTPNQAFHVNYPIIEEIITAGTQFMWPTSIDAPSENTTYVWSIKALQGNDKPYKSGANGFTNIETFIIQLNADSIDLEPCACDITLPNPSITLFQPEPMLYSRKIQLNNITQKRDYLYSCNSAISITTHDIAVTITWNDDNEETIVNNGPFQHLYAAEDVLPEFISVKYSVSPKPGYNGGQCETIFNIATPPSLQIISSEITNIAVNDTILAGKNHAFNIRVTEINETGNTGRGLVYIPWLKARMEVEFAGITVDTLRRLMTGKIVASQYENAPQYPIDWATEIVATSPWANNIANNIIDSINALNLPNISINDVALTNYSTPVKVPLGLNLNASTQLAMTEIYFGNNASAFNVVASMPLPPAIGDTQKLGFIARDINCTINNISLPMERLELIEDVTIGNASVPENKIQFIFKAPVPGNVGCYAAWNENGFSQFGVQVDVAFTRDWFIPLPDDGVSRTSASFSATGSSFSNLLLTGNFPQSMVVNAGEITVLANTIAFDMADNLNPVGMVFPPDYTGETTNLWTGFFMKNLQVKMPPTWSTNTGGPITISVNDMLVDNQGTSLNAHATNIYQYPNVNVADLMASVDTIEVNILYSSLTNCWVNGRIGLPISDTVQNPLTYKALYNNATLPGEENNFQLSIKPTGPIFANILRGQMQLDQTSSIIAYVDKNKRTFTSNIDGEMKWEDINLGPIKNVDMGLEFQNIQMNYNSSLTNKFQFSIGSWSFASPQKRLAKFPVSIENIGYQMMSTTGSEVVNGKLNFDLIINLANSSSNTSLGAKSTFFVQLAIENNPTNTKKFKPKFVGAGVSAINIDLNLSAVSIKGTLLLRNQDPIFGNGFKANITASFKTPSIEISALAEFGNTEYLNSGINYRYWRVEANILFPTGIPFLPGVAFNGFGGGASNNMQATLTTNATTGKPTYEFKPMKGNLGFMVKAIIATYPKPEGFNADVGINGQFSGAQGMINIGFTGDFYVAAPLTPQTKRNDAKIKGNLIANYNFPDKHFFFGVKVNVNASPIIVANNVNLALDINGKTNKWFFKFGEPTNLNTVAVFGINLYEYFMMGNDIQGPQYAFTTNFRDKYYEKLEKYPGGNGISGVDNNSATGRGFAIGLGVEISKNFQQHVVSGYNINLNFMAGAEINLSLLEYNAMNCDNPSQKTGINGWRANGSIGFYTSASAFVNKGIDQWTIANIKVGGWLVASLPRPNYVAGAIEGTIQIGGVTTGIHLAGCCSDCGNKYCCGQDLCASHKNTCDVDHTFNHQWCPHLHTTYLLNCNFNADFEWGDDCAKSFNQDSSDTGPTITQEDAAASQENKLIKHIHPLTSFNFPKTKPFDVKYGFPLNESFDVAEKQSSGAILTRTFKLTAVTKLEIKNDSTSVFSTVLTNSKPNDLGEISYYKSSTSISGLTALSTIKAPVIKTPAPKPILVALESKKPALSSPYPPVGPPATPGYDDLPAQNPPAVNHLDSARYYKFTVTATLIEFKNGVWGPAVKQNLQPVTQVIIKNFRTGPIQIVVANIGLNMIVPQTPKPSPTPALPKPTKAPVKKTK
ncbi:MAG: hypothetical protein HQ463_09710 [Bacteroidetes bacterium]|nr:hypothetical protein [Bacteroidota bacterium]